MGEIKQRTVGIYLFDEVEVLDFAGPFEVFSVTEYGELKPFQVFTISEKGELITARNGLKVVPDYSFENAPELDILIVPGGHGARNNEIHKKSVINWIEGQAKRVEILASVCTGAFLLAKAGLLQGKKATTHWRSLDKFTTDFPEVQVIREVKYIDEGAILTSAGISAGIDLSFHLIERLLGEKIKLQTAKRMEYTLNN